MIFEYGMGEEVSSRTLRADNYALSEQTKQLRDDEQARLTDQAYAETAPAPLQAPRRTSTGSRRAAREGDADREELRQLSSETCSPSRTPPSVRRHGPRVTSP